MENNTATETKTLRSAARELVAESVTEAAALSHERNYHKLHIRRDGSVNWSESINRSDDIIDDRADEFAAVPSVITTGTGSFACNCDHCEDVYDAADEAMAVEQGREYDKAAKYASRADAIADAVSESDLTDIENAMLAAFDEIPEGYFDDEGSDRY